MELRTIQGLLYISNASAVPSFSNHEMFWPATQTNFIDIPLLFYKLFDCFFNPLRGKPRFRQDFFPRAVFQKLVRQSDIFD
jgi:hypothetical protein